MFFFRNKHEKSDNVCPPGYSQLAGQNGTELSRDSESSRLIIKKSWDLALGPLKQVLTLINFKLYIFLLIFCHCLGTNELVYYVYGRKFDFHISNHDGWYVDSKTGQSIVYTTNK